MDIVSSVKTVKIIKSRGSYKWQLYRRIVRKYLKEFPHKLRLRVIAIYVEYGVTQKTIQLLKLTLNVCVTGLIIQYVLENRNFFSYGLLTAILMYYIRWFVELIKSPPSGGNNDLNDQDASQRLTIV